MNKKIAVFAITAAALLSSISYAKDDETLAGSKKIKNATICYVNLGQVLERADEGLDIKLKIEEEKGKFEKELSKMDKELSDLANKLQSGADKMSEKALKEAQENAMKKQGEFQAKMQAYQSFLREEAPQKYQLPFMQKLEKSIESTARKMGWDLVASEGVLCLNSEFDITEEVLSALNEDYKKEKSKKSAPAKLAAKTA